jgi:2-haloacid dehalogenase
VTAEQRQRLMEAWLHPTPYIEVAGALPRLKEKYVLAILSNGNPKMLQASLEQTGLISHFHQVLSADAVKLYKPSTRVYGLASKRMRLKKNEILFVSSNSFDVIGTKNFGFKVCWINRSEVPLDPLGFKPDLVAKSFDDLVEALCNQRTEDKS